MDVSQTSVESTPPCPRGLTPPSCMPPHLQRLLRPLSEGLSNAAIADDLCLGHQTVKNYVSEVMRACICDSRAKLAVQIGKCLAEQEKYRGN